MQKCLLILGCPSGLEGKRRTLSDGGITYFCDQCAVTEIPRREAGIKRQQAARKAVLLKREKYSTWPTRRRDHVLK